MTAPDVGATRKDRLRFLPAPGPAGGRRPHMARPLRTHRPRISPGEFSAVTDCPWNSLDCNERFVRVPETLAA